MVDGPNSSGDNRVLELKERSIEFTQHEKIEHRLEKNKNEQRLGNLWECNRRIQHSYHWSPRR